MPILTYVDFSNMGAYFMKPIERERERESTSKMGVIIPCNIISRVTLVQHCNVLLDRDKLLKLRV